MGSWVWRLIGVMSLGIVFSFVPGQVSAQGTLSGSVKDTTGAVMPGVTVEASSPALIEKTARSSATSRAATTSSTWCLATTL